jgi:hypothetical protein
MGCHLWPIAGPSSADRARFDPTVPPPWTVEETAPCFIVRDSKGKLAYVFF